MSSTLALTPPLARRPGGLAEPARRARLAVYGGARRAAGGGGAERPRRGGPDRGALRRGRPTARRSRRPPSARSWRTWSTPASATPSSACSTAATRVRVTRPRARHRRPRAGPQPGFTTRRRRRPRPSCAASAAACRSRAASWPSRRAARDRRQPRRRGGRDARRCPRRPRRPRRPSRVCSEAAREILALLLEIGGATPARLARGARPLARRVRPRARPPAAPRARPPRGRRRPRASPRRGRPRRHALLDTTLPAPHPPPPRTPPTHRRSPGHVHSPPPPRRARRRLGGGARAPPRRPSTARPTSSPSPARDRWRSPTSRLVLAVDTELLRQWIRQRYLPLLRDALFEVRGAGPRGGGQVVARRAAPPRDAEAPDRRAGRRRPRGRSTALPPRRWRGCSRASPSRPS